MGVAFIFISLITNDAELLPLLYTVKRNMHDCSEIISNFKHILCSSTLFHLSEPQSFINTFKLALHFFKVLDHAYFLDQKKLTLVQSHDWKIVRSILLHILSAPGTVSSLHKIKLMLKNTNYKDNFRRIVK